MLTLKTMQVNNNDLKTKTGVGDKFITLLWDDILFVKILPLLSIKELFILRGLSTKYKILIDSYFSKMKYLNLGKYSKVFSTDAFKVLIWKCRQLQTFIATNCFWLTNELIIPLFENNRHLTKIVLNNCRQLTSVCLQPVIINCKNLKCLSLGDCGWLTVGCLESISLHQRNLTDVDLSGCYVQFSDRTAIIKFLQLSSKLRSLNLSKLCCVDDQTMSVIAHDTKDIERINVSECKLVTTLGIRFLIEYCAKLRAVVCIGCPMVTPHILQVKHRPGLRVYCDTPISLPFIHIPGLNV